MSLLIFDSGVVVGDELTVKMTNSKVPVKSEVKKVNARSVIVKLPFEGNPIVKKKYRDVVFSKEHLNSMEDARLARKANRSKKINKGS